MAEASRALARVSRLHGFRVEETHPLFGGEAVTQSGHALPRATRQATLAAQAILVAAVEEPALAGVESELDLRAEVGRVVFSPRGVVTALGPLDDSAWDWSVERAFDIARSSRARVTLVAGDSRSRPIFRATARRNPGVLVDELPIGLAVQALAFDAEHFDVVVCPPGFAEALVGVAARGHTPRVVASGRLAGSGPGVFAPVPATEAAEPPPPLVGRLRRDYAGHGSVDEIAGQGVANPASMLLAAALMLGEGLRERRAAETLAGAVLEACRTSVRTPDMVTAGVGATTREFADAVLSELASSMTTAEFYREAVA
jgi:isocitrate/isopropylmalate dehydrogenase